MPTDQPVAAGALDRQFARTPYAVSFRSGSKTFILVTLHVLWGKSPGDRTGELRGIAQWLAGWANQVDDWEPEPDRPGRLQHRPRAATRSTRRSPPPACTHREQLNAVPRTITDDPAAPHFYDQIAWFTGEHGTPALSMTYTGHAGSFDFPNVVYPGMSRTDLSWRISDHYPLWVEFAVR